MIARVVLGSKPEGKPPNNQGSVGLGCFRQLFQVPILIARAVSSLTDLSPLHFRLVYTAQGGWLVWMLQDQSEYLLDALLGS